MLHPGGRRIGQCPRDIDQPEERVRYIAIQLIMGAKHVYIFLLH